MMQIDQTPRDIELVMQSVVTKTRDYFETEHHTGIIDVDLGVDSMPSPPLLDMTAIIGLGGLVNVQAVFSFQASLVNAVYAWMTEGFNDPPEAVEKHREAAIGELVNTVLGLCTKDLQHLDRRGIPMTPPIIVKQPCALATLNSSVFCTHSLLSAHGRLNISLIGAPKSENKTSSPPINHHDNE